MAINTQEQTSSIGVKATQERIYTFCPMCAGKCSAIATVENGKIISWERDTESGYPSEPCRHFKGLANIEFPVNPYRLKYPQKRVGARGEGKWARISWDEALDTIANKFKDVKEKYGPQGVALLVGEPRGMEFHIAQRFASVFGTPNVCSPRALCGAPEYAGAYATYGNEHMVDPDTDFENLPKVLIIWGSNLLQTRGALVRQWVRAALLNGTKLVVIDPRQTGLVNRADVWMRLRPATDAALAFGMLKVIIEEKLYDKEFIDKWTVGFDKLEEEVKTFSLEDVEKVTWIPRKQIEQVARWHAQLRPSVIHSHGGPFSQNSRGFQQNRTVHILRLITGSGNIPDWGIHSTGGPFPNAGNLFGFREWPRPADKSLGKDYPWGIRTQYMPYVALTKGILKEKESPIKAAIGLVTNPLSSYPNSREAYQALMKLDLLVMNELFMTPTAAVSDIVLPAARVGEFDTMAYSGRAGGLSCFPKLVDPPGEAWPDQKIFYELAKRLGLGEHLWESEKAFIDYMLKRSGITWDEFKSKRIVRAQRHQMEEKDITFRTPSGKVEIYSQLAIDRFKNDPLPRWKMLSPPIYDVSKEYPLLMTSAVEEMYFLTGFKTVKYLRDYKPQPTVEVHPETAKKAGLKEGEWIFIETKWGKITQKLALNPGLDPRVIIPSWGWWFPEAPPECACDWEKSNLNVIIPNEPYEAATGSTETRGIPCKIYKS